MFYLILLWQNKISSSSQIITLCLI